MADFRPDGIATASVRPYAHSAGRVGLVTRSFQNRCLTQRAFAADDHMIDRPFNCFSLLYTVFFDLQEGRRFCIVNLDQVFYISHKLSPWFFPLFTDFSGVP